MEAFRTIAPYVMLLLALVAAWMLKSPFTIGVIAAVTVAQYLASTGTLARLLVRGGPFRVEVEGKQAVEEAVERVAESSTQNEAERRAAIQELVNQASYFGWALGNIFKTPPRPVLEWDEHGKPTIAFGMGSSLFDDE